jgi:hypothetical protein
MNNKESTVVDESKLAEETITSEDTKKVSVADKPIKKQKIAKILKRVLFLIIWLIIILNIFGFDVISTLLNKFVVNIYINTMFHKYHFYIYGIILILALLIFKIHKLILGFLSLPFYIIFIFIPKYSFKASVQLIKIVTSFFTATKTLKFKITKLVILVLSAVAIVSQQNKYLVMVAMILLFLDLIWHYIRKFYSISMPVRMIGFLKDRMFNGWEKVKQDIILKNVTEWKQMDPQDEKYNQKKAESLGVAWLINRIFYRSAKYLKRAENTKIISIYFISSITFTFIYTLIIFALEYRSLSYINPESFRGLNGSNFLDYLYFSFLTFITMNFGDIIPASGLSKFLVSMEALSGIIIGLILFFIFTTIILDRYKKDMDTLINKLFQEETVLRGMLEVEFGKGIRDLLLEFSYIAGQIEGKSKQPKFLLADDDEDYIKQAEL